MTCTTDPRSGSPWDNGPFHRLPGFAGVKAKAEKRKNRAVTESMEVTRLEKAGRLRGVASTGQAGSNRKKELCTPSFWAQSRGSSPEVEICLIPSRDIPSVQRKASGFILHSKQTAS